MTFIPKTTLTYAGNPGRRGGEVECCRVCGGDLFTVLELGRHPFANGFVAEPDDTIEVHPLTLMVCTWCSTAQLSYCADDGRLYQNYNYITPDSTALMAHYQTIHEYLMATGIIHPKSDILEIGSNIGRFLEYLQPHVGSILGVDPARNIAAMANDRGIPTIPAFFNPESAKAIREDMGMVNLFITRHCFAHNEEPWLMLDGVSELMKPEGVFMIENAYFFDTVRKYEFDQIYHEHMYYHTLRSISEIVERSGMKVVDAIHSPIHGGTMIYIVMWQSANRKPSKHLALLLEQERDMHLVETYKRFKEKITQNRTALRGLLQGIVEKGGTIHAYGASAKSTTLLNYYGINSDLVPLVVDYTPTKIGKYIPMANIKIISEQEGFRNPPDYYLLTIWNYKEEIIRKVRGVGNRHSKFILPHPEVLVVGNG